MPEDEYAWLPRSSILTFEEMERLVRVFAGLGVTKVRLTGGEPLLRHDVASLVRRISAVPGIGDLAMTTNGLLLRRHAESLKAAGLGRLTISLDTLRPERALEFARTDRHADILDGIRAARDAGFTGTKLNSVVIRGYNDDEIDALLEFARREGVEVRFIEYMDVGGATRWSMAQVVTRDEILDRVARTQGTVEALPSAGAAPADRFRLADGTTFGIIASTTAPFCRDCDRSRITADGTWLLCLYAGDGLDLREALRGGADDGTIRSMIEAGWRARTDRGAEQRLAMPNREVLYQLDALRRDPHREMHTRGG